MGKENRKNYHNGCHSCYRTGTCAETNIQAKTKNVITRM